MQEKQDQKVIFVSLFIHTNFKHKEHEELTPKKIKSLSPIASLTPIFSEPKQFTN